MAEDDKGVAPPTPEGMVPSARLREESAKKREAMARVTELESLLSESEKKAATADTLAKQLEEHKLANKATKAEWETERAVWQVGLTDPEGIDIARHLHSRLPEDKRPPMAEWLKSLKDDPTKAPKALAAYLAGPEVAAPAAPAPAKAAAPASGARAATGAAPAASGGASATAPAYSTEQVREIRERATRTGDWSEYNAARPAILASLGKR